MNFVVFQDADMKRCVFDSSSIRNCRFLRIRAVEDLPLLDDPLLLDDLIHRTHHNDRMSFNAASLDSCAFESAHLAHVQGVGSQFNDCEMVNCRLRRGNFEHATFRDCSFNHCGIQKCDFLHASISECTFHDVDCSGANFSFSTLHAIEIDADTQLTNILCTHAVLTGNFWTDHDYGEEAFFDHASMMNCRFNRSTMIHANFFSATMENVRFNRVIFSFFDGVSSSANFAEATFTDVSFHYAEGAHVSFYKTKWSNCSLRDATLDHTDFTEATLLDCSLNKVNLDHAKFRKATLTQCSMNDASLNHADFTSSILTNLETNALTQLLDVTFTDAKLYSNTWTHIVDFGASRFDSAELFQCQFDHSNMARVNFCSTNLAEVSLKATILGQDADNFADFTEATLNTIATDADTVFDYCTFPNAQLRNSTLDTVSMVHCNFNYATLDHVIGIEVDLTHATFHHAQLNNFTMDRGFMNYTECNDATLEDVSWVNVKMQHSIFHKSQLTKCSLQGSEMNHAKFTEATLMHTNLDEADLSQTNFSNATLTQCSMIGANLEEAYFRDATLTEIIADADTLFLDVTFTGAKLFINEWTHIADFGESRFDNASIVQCHFDHSNMFNVSFRIAALDEVSFIATILGQDANNFADFTEATLNTIATDADTVFDYCTFSKAHWSNTTLDHVSMVNCDFNYATLDHVEYVDVDLTESTFHHATLIDVTIDEATILAGVSFIDSEMDTVEFVDTTLDNVVFDGSKLFSVNFSGASLIAASFVGATLSDTDFTDALLSEDYTEGLAEDAQVVTKFEQASLTRVTFGGTDSLLRFTIFSESTLTLCEFRGTSYYNMLNLSEANFDSTIVSDCEFSYCNLSNATFANSTLIRCHFTDCAMSDMDTENVELQYCTADEQTVLPANWMRDSNGWIALLEPGPLPLEEARHEILTLGAFSTSFRPIQRINHKLDNGVYVVTWNDGSVGDTTRLHKMSTVQPEQFQIDDAVFVCVRYDTESNDNKYLHGKILDTHLDGTYDIAYYVTSALVQYETAPTRQNHVDIFPEYFEDGEEATVANYKNQYYRLVQQINETLDDTTINVTWFDNTASNATDPLQILLNQPITVSVNAAVMVYVMSSNRYYPGVVYTDHGNNTYEIQYAYGPELPNGGGSTPTRQHIEFLYLQILPESEPVIPDEPVIEPISTNLLVGLFGNKYRAIKTLGPRIPINYMSYSSYTVTWLDDTIQNALNIQQLDTNNQSSFNKGDAVFVSIDATNDNYLPGIIDKVYSTNSTYDILYRGDFVNLATAAVNQPASKVFLQNFAFGTFLNVGIYENKYFRSIQDVLSVNEDGSLDVEWFDNTFGIATNGLQLSCVPLLYVDVGDVVFVMIENDVVTNDNHYVLGTVVSRHTGNNYNIVYSNESMIVNPENKGRVPTLQNITRIFSLKQQ